MTATPGQALAAAAHQSTHGPAFRPGLCKQKTRQLFGVPSDGSKSASESFSRTKHRIGVTPGTALPGLLVWWTGGSEGNGHVAVTAGHGRCWSVDIKRSGFFDLVNISEIHRLWPKVRLAGFSTDIDGVVVNHGYDNRGVHLTQSIRHLELADRPAAAKEIKAALAQLLKIEPLP